MADASTSWVLEIDRKRQERRAGKAYARTVSAYRVLHNGIEVPGLKGDCVERQGPGDNSATGVRQHRRIEAGTYEIFTHDGAHNKYQTFGYATSDAIKALPRPSLRLSPTGDRSGILIHPASGYLWSIGCINLGHSIAGPESNLQWKDSRRRVIALIDDRKSYLGTFPRRNNIRIPRASCIIYGEP